MKEKSHTTQKTFNDEWLTPKEAASLLKIHRSTIYRWADEGLLTLYNLGNRLTRLKRTEVEQLIEPKKHHDIRQTPARLGVATTTDLEAVFMPLARKHDVEEQKAQKLMRELEEVLGIRKKPDERSFDETLHDARIAFDQMANHLIDDEYPVYLQMFANEVKALLDKLSKVNERRGQLVILLKKAVRQWQKSAERATTGQVEALKAVFDCLKNETPQKDDVMACADKLEDAGIQIITIQSAALAEALIEWTDEGYAGIGDYDEDFLGDIDSDSETALRG
ncbi:helix-turn-helix domain-containing protein [bacterium]|nr:helix-turn-helix domain-containing protein [bacterium]